jgi:hypothetical protein
MLAQRLNARTVLDSERVSSSFPVPPSTSLVIRR